jgi:hypothetical protein
MSDSQAITSRPWAALASYTDAEWHEIWASLFDGEDERGPLLAYLSSFEVSASSPAGMSVTVGTGAGLVRGVWCQNETARTLAVAANGGGATRYDLVFLHWTRATQQVAVRVVDGTAATCATAVAPAANAIATYQAAGPPATEWAVPLACVAVDPGAVQILAGDVVDLREFCRYRTDPGDLPDGVTVGVNAARQLYVLDDGVGVDQISSAIAGDGLGGGDGAALAVTAGTGLEVSGDTLQIAAAAAGDGLTGGGGAALDVNADGTTIQIVGDTLSVLSATHANIANRYRIARFGANCLYLRTGSTATWGTLAGFPAQAEGWICPQSVNNFLVCHQQLPADMLAGTHVWEVRVIWAHVWGGVSKSIALSCARLANFPCGGSLTTTAPSTAIYETVSSTTANLRRCSAYIYENPLALDAGEYMDFFIGRSGTSVSDNLLDDILILGIEIRYTADM